jgi:hypothetical protein
MRARLGYHIDKSSDRFRIDYPARFGTDIETREFKLSELKSIVLKGAIMPSGTNLDVQRGPQRMKGFDFELESGEMVHCGIYSTSRKEIFDIIQKITQFKKVPVINSDKTEIIWG